MKIFDCVGVGAGPANLSLACLMSDKDKQNSLFLDKKKEFIWHEGMLIKDAKLQVSIFKDLVTLADPSNPFTFINYLHDQGRIYQYLNADFEHVTRQEFAQYFAWAAKKCPNVHFGEEVKSINFSDHFIIETNKRVVHSKNVVVGNGIKGNVPECVRPHLCDNNFHVSEYMMRDIDYSDKTVAVIGGGQSGAEIFLDLLSKGKDRPKHVAWISRKQSYFPIDDSPFTNDFYMPCFVEYLQNHSIEIRKKFVSENILTSDGISGHTLKEIYQKLYVTKYLESHNEDPFTLLPDRSVTEVKKFNKGWQLYTEHAKLEESEYHNADIVIWATGFKPAPKSFLSPIIERFEMVENEFSIDEDYAAVWNGPEDRNLYIQNATRMQKGLADPNLSLLAWRSQKILLRIKNQHNLKPQTPSMVTWNGVDQGLHQLDSFNLYG